MTAAPSLAPGEMAEKAAQIGIRKTNWSVGQLFVLSFLAGMYIAFGAIFATLVSTGAAGVFPFGVTKLLAGLVFTVGLILVVVGGAELFAGSILMVMAYANRQISLGGLLRNWAWVYFGNLVGSVSTALLVFLSGHYLFNNGNVGLNMLSIAEAKTGLPFLQATALGVLCNILVSLAVWLTYSAQTVGGKILAIIPPIAAFVAAGFEHSVANMYFIPMGLMVKYGADGHFWELIQKSAADFPHLTVTGFILHNLIPVTIGNILGGMLIGLAYWWVYLHHK